MTHDILALYVGKFTTMGMPKGLDESIHAVRRLRKEGLRVSLLAVGGTVQELERYAPYKGEGITFLGHQPQKELKRFYAAADMVLMPFPFTEHYAFFMSPLKLFEYLKSGLPIIASDLPSVREILAEDSAWLVKPGSVEELAKAMKECVEKPDLARERAFVSRSLADRYTWKERARRIVVVLETLQKYEHASSLR